jgi:glucose-6-phosphate 1-epimerase
MPDQLFELTEGQDNQPVVRLTAPDGARAEIYLNGAHVTSWVPVGGSEQLFLSPLSGFGPGASIRGGVPVIFPQFSGEGSLPKHGFARKQRWEFLEMKKTTAGAAARFGARDDETTRAIWPHAFLTELEVTLGGNTLRVTLKVANAGASPFSFTAALHTYYAVDDIGHVAIEGLAGLPYLDTVGERTHRIQQEQNLTFDREVDRIYYNASGPLVLHEDNRRLTIRSSHFPDSVVWNPWAELTAVLPDMQPDSYRRMVCIEAVVVGNPVVLQPGEHWSGYQESTLEV